MAGKLPHGGRVVLAVSAITGSVALTVAAGISGAASGSPPWAIVIDLGVGFAFLLAAATAIAPPLPRLLAAAVGVLWLLGSIAPDLGAAHRTALAICLLVFPAARISGVIPWALVALSLPIATGLVPQLLVAGVFAAVAATRIAYGEPPGQRGRRRGLSGPTTASVGGAIAIALSAAAASIVPRPLDSVTVLLLYEAALLSVATALVTSTRLRQFRTADLPDVLLATGGVGVAGLSSILRHVLRDPDLRIMAVDGEADPAELDPDAPKPARLERIEVRDGVERIGTLVHRPGSIPDERTARSILEAARLTVVHERTTVELERQRAALAAAQERIGVAAERRRHDLASRLRGGVLAPLDEARAAVASARRRAGSEDSKSALAVVAEQLAGTEREVRGIVDGSLRELGGGRLHGVLRSLAARHATVELFVGPDAIGDAETEAALRFVASELVTNALKHASAQRVLVRLALLDGQLVLTVSDDGAGGADPDGSGLTGLAGRVRSRGGRLIVNSPAGAGTTATASIPVSRPSPTAR
ncbi:hypothetical protein J7E25_00350 [Agromyces sp. ISL-38]|uniref:sensor histidine kinase n=1 Tax=Agromyces sp. ISL-38 TaxID=2819107 RepID=UPI001BEA5BFB|nr:ATP-binding protein [Agromyces sp. ISL-38]MBT2497541.1 hypothetical protein [Agromyces sp. ISL-38]MBT2517358.1 hypothetical protein [Streptomyces sp. ISL-90]